MPDYPQYLMRMPRKVLFGQAREIERWCKKHEKERPTLLDLELARQEVRRRRADK